ncbi:MAG: DUF6067 family protein [bacterium]|nr:DUF6067 family protein [bacterium]
MLTKKILLVMALNLFICGVCYADMKIAIVNNSEKIRPETNINYNHCPKIRLFSAKNEYESFQLVLENTHNEDVSAKLKISDLFSENGNIFDCANITIYSVKYVDVTKFSSNPGKWPDPLVKITDNNVSIEKKTRIVLWFTVYVPSYVSKGIYKGNIAVEFEYGESENIEIELAVWDFSLSETPALKTAFALWPGFIAKRHNVPLESKELKAITEIYWENMLEHKVSNLNYIYPEIENVRGNAKIDFSDFDKKMEYYIGKGITSFNIFWSGIPYTYGEQKPSEIPGDFENYIFVKQVLQKTEQHLKKRGWLEKGYIYLTDEPDVKYFNILKNTLSQINSISPEIKRLVTIGYAASTTSGANGYEYKKLAGYVDIWVIHTDRIDQQFLEERQQKGDEIWWYVTCGTRRPYANFWAIDYTTVENRILFWQAFKYKAQGLLYWCINYWNKDVWNNPVAYADCNGEGSLIYWGKSGPVNSVRWEIIRDGIEDYEYLDILSRKIHELEALNSYGEYSHLLAEAKRIAEISLVSNMTDFTDNLSELLKIRIQIGNIIAEISDIVREYDQKD